jgi:hypothetical protein
MVSILCSKGTESQTGLKNKTWPFVGYNKYISSANTNTGLEWKDRQKNNFQANRVPKQAVIAI